MMVAHSDTSTDGSSALRGRRPGDSLFDITLAGANYIFREGHRIAVAVQNHTWHRPVGIAVRTCELYVVLAGLSGTVLGLQFLGNTVSMNWDFLTTLTLLVAPSAPFTRFIGILDAKGRAMPRFAPPAGLLPKELIGANISFAAVSLSKTSRLSVSGMSWLKVAP